MSRGTTDHHLQGRYDAAVDCAELVVGLRWDPVPQPGRLPPSPLDLDVACLLLDEQGRVIDVIHPGNARWGNDCVIHTGDSKTGAGEWDDERIFVFPAAVPPVVAALTFVVATIGDRGFTEATHASCHVSDPASERVLIHLEIGAPGEGAMHPVATLYRTANTWRICEGVRNSETQDWISGNLAALLAGAKKTGESGRTTGQRRTS
jgi:tellurium resistance protein TerZ